MTEKELISRLQTLKQIKPRKDWVILAKNQILGLSAKAESNFFKAKATINNKPNYREVLLNIFRMSFQRKFAYTLGAFLFIVLGVFGFINYSLPGDQNLKVAKESPAALVAIKNNVEDFKTKSKNLSEIAKFNPKDIPLAIKEVKDAAKEITDAVQKDPKLAKEIALEVNNNKTYLNVVEADDLKETSDILYKTIVEQMIKDLENTILTESQQETLKTIKDLYNEKRYSNALESALLLNAAMTNS